MTKNLPILTFVLTLVLSGSWGGNSRSNAQEKRAAEAKSSSSATTVLTNARASLNKQGSLRARLIETIRLPDRKFKAVGKYLQGSNLRLRLELELQLGKTKASLLEVCDGQILYMRKVIGEEQTLTRRDVQEIRDAAAKSGGLADVDLVSQLGLGGLPALLASLQRSMDFSVLREETFDNHPVFMIQGTWNAELRRRLTARSPSQGKAAAELPAFVPDLVRLYLDEKTGFPHRIQYLKRLPDQSKSRPMLTLDFKDVQFGPIDESEFVYVRPADVVEEDVTEQYIKRIQEFAARSQQAAPAKKKKE